MAPFITHLLIGERVCARLSWLRHDTRVYGAFLLGCLLVDVNHFSTVGRYETHLIERGARREGEPYTERAASFLARLDQLLRHPWSTLTTEEQAFVSGYLCHLAADDAWEAYGLSLWQRHPDYPPPRFSVPLPVILTAFSWLSWSCFADREAALCAVWDAQPPDILVHLPPDDLVRMWDIIRPHILDAASPSSYVQVYQRAGRSLAEIAESQAVHERHWQAALDSIQEVGGIEPYVVTAVERATSALTQLWTMR